MRRPPVLFVIAALLAVTGLLRAVNPAGAQQQTFSLPRESLPRLVSVTPPLSQSTTCDVATASGPVIQIPQLALATCTMTFSPSPVADGSVILSTANQGPGSAPAIIGCATACQIQQGGLQVLIPCGATAPSGTTQSATCTSITFTVQSPIWACITNPTNLCPQGGNLNATAAVILVTFLATPGNGGASGGGTELPPLSFSFQSPSPGTLLVTASPAIIPSNGSLGSVISATFSCPDPNAITQVNGFPLSNGAQITDILPAPSLQPAKPPSAAPVSPGYSISRLHRAFCSTMAARMSPSLAVSDPT